MRTLVLIVALFTGVSAFAQRDLTPSKKRDAFGTRDLRNLRNFGLQFQLGPTYMLTRLDKNNEVITATPTAVSPFRGNYTHDPYGRIGAYGEIGLFHFPKKRSKLSLALKTVLVSYYDYGIGFKYFRGGENNLVNYTDAAGNVVNTEERAYEMSNGNIYGRFSIHKNIHFKWHREKTNFFLDNSLGINVDYRLLTTSDDYNWSPITDQAKYYNPLHVQLHYGLGFGFRLKRGSYLIPGVRLPILGYQTAVTELTGDKNNFFGKPSMHWFSSRYWPMLFHVKYMFVFEKKAKGCPAVEINDQDKETQRNR